MPWALAYTEEEQYVQMEREQGMIKGANEVCFIPFSPSILTGIVGWLLIFVFKYRCWLLVAQVLCKVSCKKVRSRRCNNNIDNTGKGKKGKEEMEDEEARNKTRKHGLIYL